jgi:ParB/RepB/Spo0J family partition protein
LSGEDKPKPETTEDLKTLLGDLSTLLDFEDKGDAIIANIKQYIGTETFSKLATSIEKLGGRYVSEPDRWRFIIPKATVQKPDLPDLTQVPNGTMLKTPVSRIQRGKFWVRRHLDEHEMSKLRESIRRNGDVTYPLAVYPLNSSRVELLGGHRRLQACKEAGVLTVSVRVFHPKTEREKWELSLQDEMHEPWSPMAKATAYRKIKDEGMSIEDITLMTGEPYETVKSHLALNDLPDDVQQLIDSGDLGISFGLALLKLRDNPQQCIALARNAVHSAWTRQKLEDEISEIRAPLTERGDFPELPVTLGESFFSEKEPFPRRTGSSTEKREIGKEAQTKRFSATVSEEPEQSYAQKAKRTETRRDTAWDLALRYYPISLVDFVWERVTVEGRRLEFLKTICQAEHVLIIEHNLLERVWEIARRDIETRRLD